MTKSSPKKVIKNLQRPTNRRGKYEVIKHFEPSKIYTACHTNLQAEIPKINANNDEKENKKQRKMLVKIPCNAPCANFREPSPLINNLSSVQKIECQRKNTFKRNKKPPFKSSSSSSLEVDLEKFTNKKRVKSKSFHSGQPKIPAGSEKTISNFRERSLSPRLKRTSLKSVTDPVLIQKELNLKSLKQEILENKRVLASEKQKPTKNLIAYDEKGPQIQNLKDEISHSKHMSILHKKIFITELKSEIAEYKKCSNFVVYNSQSGSTPRLDNKQNSEKVLPKSPKRTSLYEDMNAEKLPLEAKRCCWEIDTGEFLSGGVEQSRTGTDKESFLDTTDERPSTKEEPYKLQQKPKDISYSDTDSVDDEIIKMKIQEANQLIEKVKKALEKMKCIKTKSSEEVKKNTSSGTDIEDTIKQLKKETEKLITGDINEEASEEVTSRPKTGRCNRESIQTHSHGSQESIPKSKRKDSQNSENRTSYSSSLLNKTLDKKNNEKKWSGSSDEHITEEPTPKMFSKTRPCYEKKIENRTSYSSTSLNKTLDKKDNEKKWSGSSDEHITEEPAPKMFSKTRPCFEKDLENARKKSAEDSLPLKDCCLPKKPIMERPRTRRNETEDEMPDELRLDKFRNHPDDDQIEVTSSLEELQAKLQTISESTESSLSTPRNKKSETQTAASLKDFKSCTCGTKKIEVKDKEIQVIPERKTVGVLCHSISDNKTVQTNCCPEKTLIPINIRVESISPTPRNLEKINLEKHEIAPTVEKCRQCQVEILPIQEMAPTNEKMLCSKCRKELKEEHLGGVSISSRNDKLQKLTIKVLPPIIIKEQWLVKQVQHFYITPEGETKNLLKNADNAAFETIDDLPLKSKTQPETKEVEEEDEEEELVIDGNDDLVLTVDNEDTPGDSGSPSSHENDDSRTVSRLKTLDSKYFLKLRASIAKNMDILPDADKPTYENLDEDEKKRFLFYKSYNLLDNPNRHDPGSMDTETVEKISEMDLNFYKTFINPEGKVSEREIHQPKSIPGFESKEVQCSDTMQMVADAVGLTTGEIQRASNRISPTEHPDNTRGSTKWLNFKVIPRARLTHDTIEALSKPLAVSKASKEMSSDSKIPIAVKEPSIIVREPSITIRDPSTSFPMLQMDSQTTIVKLKEGDSKGIPQRKSILLAPKSVTETSSKHLAMDDVGDSSPSEITLTLSYSESSEEGYLNQPDDKKMYHPSQPTVEPKVLPIDAILTADTSTNKSLDNANQQSNDFPLVYSSDRDEIKTLNLETWPSSRFQNSSKSREDSVATNLEIKKTYDSLRSKSGDSVDMETKKLYLGVGPQKQSSDVAQPRVKSTELTQNMERRSGDLDSKIEQRKSCSSDEQRLLTLKDKEIIQKLHEKFKSVDTTASNPVLKLKPDNSNDETINTFIKGLTRIGTESHSSNTDEDGSSNGSEENKVIINYHHIKTDLESKVNLFSKHLILAENGRYKDEENLFVPTMYPSPTHYTQRDNFPRQNPRSINNKRDEEVQKRKLEIYPRQRLRKYSPDTTNSDTVTTNSLSEGEIRCKHSVSNGEVHVCRYNNYQSPPTRRNVLRRTILTNPSITPFETFSSKRNTLTRTTLRGRSISPSGRNTLSPTKFSLTDPKVTIEQRRNYFNNWVTYYVKTQEIINDSSTSSCSHNK